MNSDYHYYNHRNADLKTVFVVYFTVVRQLLMLTISLRLETPVLTHPPTSSNSVSGCPVHNRNIKRNIEYNQTYKSHTWYLRASGKMMADTILLIFTPVNWHATSCDIKPIR